MPGADTSSIDGYAAGFHEKLEIRKESDVRV